jgi:hypothetical protein
MKPVRFTNFKQRLSRWILPDLHQENWIELFFLALVVGGYVLFVLIVAFLPGGIIVREEQKIFILGWTLVPTCAVSSVPVWVWIRRKLLGQVSDPFNILLFVNALLFVFLTTGFDLNWQLTKSIPLPAVYQPGVSKYFTSGIAGTPTSISINRRGRYIRVQLTETNYLSLAEVEVIGETGPTATLKPVDDLARGKAATQSSTLNGSIASRAVDGNTDGNWWDNSVSHTDANSLAWWQVDLGAIYPIQTIRIWNRTDGASNRLSNFNVLVSNTPFSLVPLDLMFAGAAALLIPLINLIAILVLKSNITIKPVPMWELTAVGSVGLLNFIGLFPYFSGQYSTPLYLLDISVLVGLAALIVNRPKFISIQNRYLLLGFDFLVILLIICACFDPTFSIEKYGQSFYLGPANRLLHGGSMLVDGFSQYGILVIYFIAFLVKSRLMPLTYQGFSLAIAVLMVIQFSIIYLFLITLVKDRFYAILLLVLTLLLGIFGSLGVVQAFPSTGPLRFGLAYLVLAAVFLRHRFLRLDRAVLILEYFLVGITSLWSFETFVYTAFMYLGICLFESLGKSVRFRQILWSFICRLFWLFVTIAIFQSLFALGTYVRAGAWPDWGIYFGFIKLYTGGTGGYYSLLIEPWSPWIFPVAVYFVSLMVFVFRYLFLKNLAYSPESELIFGLTFFGIAQYTYFLGRSHPNNLYHISAPAVIIAGYWFVKLISQKSLPASFRGVIKFVFYSAAALSILATLPSFVTKYRQDHTGFKIVFETFQTVVIDHSIDLERQWAVLRDSFIGESPPALVSDSVELLRKYTPGQREATVFLPAQYMTETLILAGRVDRFPINDPYEDSNSEQITNRILAYPQDLRTNDIIILAEDPNIFTNDPYGDSEANALTIKLINRLCQEFSFEEIEHTPGGAIAVRLKNFDGNPTAYCATMKSLGTP